MKKIKNLVFILILAFQTNVFAADSSELLSERFGAIADELISIEESRLEQKEVLLENRNRLKEIRLRIEEIDASLERIEFLRDEMNLYKGS